MRTPIARPPAMSMSAHLRTDLIMRRYRAAQPLSVVEVGPGMGGMSWYLARGVSYRGYEPDQKAFKVAQSRLMEMPDAILINDPIPQEPDLRFDALVALEVLEHLDDDALALRRWVKWLNPGGVMIVSVPAHQRRYGPMDEAVGHHRRYSRVDLFEKLRSVGLSDIEVSAYGMPLGYVLEFARNKVLVNRLAATSDLGEQTARSGRIFQPDTFPTLYKALAWPFRLIQKPFQDSELGTGFVASGRLGI